MVRIDEAYSSFSMALPLDSVTCFHVLPVEQFPPPVRKPQAVTLEFSHLFLTQARMSINLKRSHESIK